MKESDMKELNNLLVSVFNTILKIEEAALKASSDNKLSITEVHTLHAIGQGAPRTMTEVAVDLMINVSTLTIAINKLVEKGYVSRCRGEDDRRVVRIELTKPGLVIMEEHEKFHHTMVAQVVASLGEEEAKVLLSSMDNLKEFFRKQQEKLKL